MAAEGLPQQLTFDFCRKDQFEGQQIIDIRLERELNELREAVSYTVHNVYQQIEEEDRFRPGTHSAVYSGAKFVHGRESQGRTPPKTTCGSKPTASRGKRKSDIGEASDKAKNEGDLPN